VFVAAPLCLITLPRSSLRPLRDSAIPSSARSSLRRSVTSFRRDSVPRCFAAPISLGLTNINPIHTIIHIRRRRRYRSTNMNKTIYMTYHSKLPSFVTSRWLHLNPDYRIDFSMDADCISFLQTTFGRNIAELFKYIPRGMYKADLWRLCKLYIHGGVYADIDLVPHFKISAALDSGSCVYGSGATFYSCLSMSYNSIFQAFMKHSRARSPLILGCLISFLINKPYTDIDNGPTRDMYRFLLYNIRHQTGVGTTIAPHTRYTLRQIRIPVTIPANEDIIPLYYFPDDVKYSISISPDTKDEYILANRDKYRFYIKDNHLFADADADTATDTDAMVVDICIDLPEDEPEVIFLFEECIRIPGSISTCYISHNNQNIMDCRDARYIRDSGWVALAPPSIAS
jgi:hypothetical protein